MPAYTKGFVMTANGLSTAQAVVTRRTDKAGGSHIADVQSNYFLRSEHTGGAFSLTEIVFQPGSQGTPLHIHTHEEETYYVIEGKMEVHFGDQKVTLGPGGSVVLPRNIKHKVFPSGDIVTRALMIISPPGLEKMLMQLDAISPGEFDIQAVMRLSEQYGIQILPDEG